MPPHTYRDVKASGIRLRVTDVGSGPALLLLHTHFLDRSCWDLMLHQLSLDFRVVAPDLPGFGESEKPSPARFEYTVDAFRHVVTDLYAGLGLGQAHLLGHGLGGAIAVALASRNPELVQRLLLVNAMCYRTPPDAARRVAGLPLLGGFLFKQLLGKAAFRTYFREVLLTKQARMASDRLDHYYQTFATPAGRNSALTTLRNTADTRAVVAQLTRISVPTLVVWGRQDALYRAAFGQRLAREIPGAGFELLNSGHLPQEEQPEKLASITRDFCLARRRGL